MSDEAKFKNCNLRISPLFGPPDSTYNEQMYKKLFLGVSVVVLLTVVVVIVRSFTSSSTDASTFIQGDLTIRAGEIRTIYGGSPLSVTGDLTVIGTLECDSSPGATGSLHITVGGTLSVSGKIECLLENMSDRVTPALSIVAPKIIFTESSQLAANGSVDIVAHESDLLNDPLLIETWRTSTKINGTTISALGPFTDGNPMRDIREGSGTSRSEARVAATLAGTWHIGDMIAQSAAPTDATKRNVTMPFLHLDMSDEGLVRMKGLKIESGDGKTGTHDIGADCDALGGTGDDALFFRIHAGNIIADDLSIVFGNGGKGGDAETRGDCSLGQAIAGRGGRPGNLYWTAAGTIEVSRIAITPGKGGRGGDATAHGKSGTDACPGEAGGSARAVGGDGGGSGYVLSMQGDARGVDHITISRVVGGDGGNGTAIAGPGGNGNACGCQGGKGGASETRGGSGGAGTVLLLTNTVEGHGGDAGHAGSRGGVGGNGGQCTVKDTGGNGGDGGAATATAGTGGNGTTAKGNDGSVKEMVGGDGGTGGTGCPPGAGGVGGLGAPLGITQPKGTTLCANIPVITPKTTGVQLVKAILYHGIYLPKDQLLISDTAGCGEKHWRAAKGVVIATNGESIADPLFACGFGKVSESPIVDTPASVLDIDKGAQ